MKYSLVSLLLICSLCSCSQKIWGLRETTPTAEAVQNTDSTESPTKQRVFYVEEGQPRARAQAGLSALDVEEQNRSAQAISRPAPSTTARAQAGSQSFQEAPATPKNISGRRVVEILLQIPEDIIDRYFVRFGTNPQDLTSEVAFTVSSLEKIKHAQLGNVFRLALPITTTEQIFLSIAAENNAGRSEFSTPILASNSGAQ